MWKQFRVIILVKNSESTFYAYIKTVGGRDKGDALMSALIEHSARGGDLDLVAKTSVVELTVASAPKVAPQSGRTMMGLQPIRY